MKTIPLPRKVRYFFRQNEGTTTWSFCGAFTIVLNKRNEKVNAEILRGLEMGGFSVWGNFASCANIFIEGVEDHSSLIFGVVMDDIENFFSYDHVERIVTADGQVLWEEKT